MKFILLLCCLGLAAARPSRPKTRMLQNLFSPLLHLRQVIAGGGYLRRQTGDDATCGKALSDALGDVLSRIQDIPDLPPILADEGNLREISLRSTGLDLFDDAARQGLCCALTKVESVSGLKETLSDVIYHQFRVWYDIIEIASQYALANSRPEGETIHTIESLGLLHLDPEGVAWIVDFVGFLDDFMVADEPEISDASLMEKCAILQNLAAEHMLMSSYPVLDWTSINADTVNRLLCDIVGAAEEGGLRGLRAIYDVIDSYGIIDALIRKGYPLGAQSLKNEKQDLQRQLDFIDNFGNGPLHGKPPGPPWFRIPEMVDLMRAVLKLINAVEAEGLLDLELDL